MADAIDCAGWKVPRHRMAFLEGRGLDGKHPVHLAFLRAVVGYREAQAGGGAGRILVAELERVRLPAGLRTLPPRLGLHLCVSVYMDSVHSESDDRPSSGTVIEDVFWLPDKGAEISQILPGMRIQFGR